MVYLKLKLRNTEKKETGWNHLSAIKYSKNLICFTKKKLTYGVKVNKVAKTQPNPMIISGILLLPILPVNGMKKSNNSIAMLIEKEVGIREIVK